jgi:hypothetical protein
MPESLSPENLERVGPSLLRAELLRRFGLNPVDMLAAAALDAKALDDPEAMIPYAAAGLLLEVAADKTHCPHFGLEVGNFIRTTTLGLCRRTDAKCADDRRCVTGFCHPPAVGQIFLSNPAQMTPDADAGANLAQA